MFALARDAAPGVHDENRRGCRPCLQLRVRELEGDEEFQVPLNGHEVAALIGGEGPFVGRMLDRLMKHRLRTGPLSKEQAIALVQDWQKSS